MTFFRRRGQARVLSDYVDALVVRRRTGRDRPARHADEHDEAARIEELIELVQVLSTVDIAMPPGFADRLAHEIAAEQQAEQHAQQRAELRARHDVAQRAMTRTISQTISRTMPPTVPRRSRILPLAAGLGSRRFFAASTAVFLTAALIVFDLRQSPLSAAELLRHSVDAARVEDSRPGLVMHRVMRLEQRDPASGSVIDRRDIEIWERADRGVKARRAFDQRHRLVAGEWKRGSAVRTVYATPSAIEDLEAQSERAALDARSVWQLDVSAADFLALLPDPRRARVTTTPTMYIVAYEGSAETSGLVRASLTLRKDGLWPVRQTLVVKESGALSEFRFEEATFERLPEKRVSARVFEPDPGLWDEKVEPPPAPKPRVTPPPAPAPAPVVPSVNVGRLLLNAWFRVHRLDACLNEHTAIDLDGERVSVHAAVPDEEHRALLVRAFDSFTPADRLQLDVEAPPASPIAADDTSASAPALAPAATVARPAAWAAIREHFRKRVGFLPEQEVGPQLDVATEQFAAWVVERSTRRVQELRALERHLAPWSAERLASLDLDARAAWIAMLRHHARAFRQETELLRVQLQAVFVPIAAPPVQGDGAIESGGDGAGVTDAQLVQLSQRLLRIAEREDALITGAFTSQPVSAGSPRPVDIVSLVQDLASAERLASRFDAPQWLDR